MRNVKAFVLPLVLGLALSAMAQIPTCTRQCCSDHFTVIQGFVSQLQSLQKQVRAEDVQAFGNQYDQQKAQTFLGLTAGAFQDAANHFGQLKDAANQKAASQIASMLLAEQKKLAADMKPDQAKADFTSFDLAIPLPANAPAAAPAGTK